MVASKDECEAWREEDLSDLHDHIEDLRAEGYRPDVIAVHILLRVVRGMKDDVARSVPHARNALAKRLESGSVALSHFRASTTMIAAVAVFCMMNVSFLMSEDSMSWVGLLGLNVTLAIVLTVICNQHHLWARRALSIYIGTVLALLVGVLAWVVLQQRLYEMPNFNPLMLQVFFAVLPLTLGMAVHSEMCRVRVFKGHRWPVYVSWAVIAAASLGTAIPLGLTFVLMAWGLMVMMVIGLTVMAVIFTIVSTIVCYVGLKGSALSLRLMAAGIRRLD